MTGKAKATQQRSTLPWYDRLLPQHCRYLAVDGGAGAQLLAELAGYNGYLKPANSPRHANLLLVFGPVARPLAPAIVQLAKALPKPAGAVVVTDPRLEGLASEELAKTEELLPGAFKVESLSAGEISSATLEACRHPGLQVASGPAPESRTVSIPPQEEQEIATEMAVLSLGPVNPFVSGPLGLLLVCDGEQVARAEVESGYAHRGIADAMTRSDWRDAADLASALDPLAPLACRLAYVRALERLQGQETKADVEALRQAAVALERVKNCLWWVVRFFDILDMPSLTHRSWKLARAASGVADRFWERPIMEWIAPQDGTTPINQAALKDAISVVELLWAFYDRAESDRALGLRTRGIGMMAEVQLNQAGVTGPVFQAAQQHQGDVHSRLLTRIRAAAHDLRETVDIAVDAREFPDEPRWEAPSGETTASVIGPRGEIGVTLTSNGGDGPAAVQWSSPSAKLLGLVPQALIGQKVADAEVILASLDLAMAEADG